MANKFANFYIFNDILKSVEEGETELGMTYEEARKDLRLRTTTYIYRHQGGDMHDLITDVLRSDEQLARDLIGFGIQATADPDLDDS